MIYADVSENSYKEWYGYLFDNDDVKTEWGRVGEYKKQSKDFPGAGESFFDKKVREKEKKGYVIEKRLDGTQGASIPVANSNLHEIAKKQIIKDSTNSVLSKLVERFVQSNVHKITSSTNISYNSQTGLFTLVNGSIITPEAIVEARDILAEITKYVRNRNYGNVFNKVVVDYLKLVPQHIGMKFNVRNIFPDEDSCQKQNDILDSLESSVNTLKNSNNITVNEDSGEEVFKVDLEILDDSKEFNRLSGWYKSSMKSCHGYDSIKIKNIFRVKIHEMDNGFNKNLGNNIEVFHGTSEANCLSILKSGLKTAPPSTAYITYKLWGNGIYGAINSSKSLGYTYGKWGNSVGESGWLYICDFAMGNTYFPNSGGQSRKPFTSGYDSTWAKAGNTGLLHDELIVYENSQVNIKYLIECK